MSYLRTEVFEGIGLNNSDMKMAYYSCDGCGLEMPVMWPMTVIPEKDIHLCRDCGFKEGYLTEKEYLGECGINISDAHAAVRDGKVVIWFGKKAPWEKSSKEIRSSSEYRTWRTGVLERDEYTCQHCGVVDQDLHAHHIKPFAKYKKLRFAVSNGLTLCATCHKEVHKKKG